MKIQFRQKSIIAVVLTLIFLIVGVNCLPQTFAQGSKRLANKSDVWFASYTVTIKGFGKEEPEIGSGDPEITWSVERIYNGNIKLASGIRVADTKWSDKEREESIWTERKIRFKDSAPQVHVRIKDYVHKKFDPTCEEYTTEIETWNADVRGLTPKGDEAFLTIDNKYLTHDVSFPSIYMPKGTAFDVKYQKDIFSFPKKERKDGGTKFLSILAYRIPDIKDWLEKNGEVTRDNEPFLEADGSYIIKSKEITVNESLLPGIDTSGKVTIQVEYIIKKQTD